MPNHSQSLRNNSKYNRAGDSCDDLSGLFSSGRDGFYRLKLVALSIILKKFEFT